MVAVLGINAYHADASACLLVDGVIAAAAEEERFTRVKHWAGLPMRAISYCLDHAGIGLRDVAAIAVNAQPRANLAVKLAAVLRHGLSPARLAARLGRRRQLGGLAGGLAAGFDLPVGLVAGRLRRYEHHDCHIAQARMMIPEDWTGGVALASIDGFGDGLSAKWGVDAAGGLRQAGRVGFPHSLGLFYLAVTQHLGFWDYGDEYKVMGLAATGAPELRDAFRQVLRQDADGRFQLDLGCFSHHHGGAAMAFPEGVPRIGPVYCDGLSRLIGPPRRPGEAITDRHRAIAASAQQRFEEVVAGLLAPLRRAIAGPALLGLAGGCAMNSLCVGRLAAATGFARVLVPPGAGDAGGAAGAAALAWVEIAGTHPRWPAALGLGPGYDGAAVEAAVAARQAELSAAGIAITRPADPADAAAERLAAGAVLGWFQGRGEWGARALGQRSILCDPGRADARDLLNHRIKRREPFRPFAPAVLEEAAGEWFETSHPIPHMTHVVPVRPARRQRIPAVVHADGSARPQTVSAAASPDFHRLIAAFAARTGLPLVLNTSFNENEPIVDTPAQAVDCFLRTGMDALAIGPLLLERTSAGA
ncbi:MAG: carbamoyltransferase C-terminal domain-containing protein [Thalassobaculales bacterium]